MGLSQVFTRLENKTRALSAHISALFYKGVVTLCFAVELPCIWLLIYVLRCTPGVSLRYADWRDINIFDISMINIVLRFRIYMEIMGRFSVATSFLDYLC